VVVITLIILSSVKVVAGTDNSIFWKIVWNTGANMVVTQDDLEAQAFLEMNKKIA
jgi:hypothetical protein